MDFKSLIAKKKPAVDKAEGGKAQKPSALMEFLGAFGSTDWAGILRKSAHPQAASDLNAFIERMPQTVGQTMLIILGGTWAVAGATGLYTTVQLQQLTEIRAELEEGQALQPIVPMIKDVPVSAGDVQKFVENIKEIYQGLDIRGEGASVLIAAKSTAQFGQFREAIGHVQNGGSGWRVNISRFCVGRECGANPLAAALQINKVSVEKPR